MAESNFEHLGELLDAVDSDFGEPPRYRVLLHNDHYTTMEFVIEVLVEIFHHSPATAEKIMLMVHRQGVGCCGEYDREIAESKVAAVAGRAAEAGFPLRCTMEKV